MNDNKEERMEIKHEAEPGYKGIFYVVFAVTALYLCIIFGLG